MKYLGIDYGSKRVGIGISDEAGKMAFPYRVLPNDHLLIKEVVAILEKENIAQIVMGDSRDFRGAENAIMKSARKFLEQLIRHTTVPVHLEGEIYTTQEAKRSLPGAMLDASAAALILQGFLDKKNSTS